MAKTSVIAALEIEYKRDEKIMRFLTTALDKHSIAYNQKRKKGDFKKSEKTEKTEKTEREVAKV